MRRTVRAESRSAKNVEDLPSHACKVLKRLDSIAEECLFKFGRYLDSHNFEVKLRYHGIHGVVVSVPEAGAEYFTFGERTSPIESAFSEMRRVVDLRLPFLDHPTQDHTFMLMLIQSLEDQLEACRPSSPKSLVVASRPYFTTDGDTDKPHKVIFACALITLEGKNVYRPFQTSHRSWRETRLRPVSEESHSTLMPRSFAEFLAFEYMSVIIEASINEFEPSLPLNFSRTYGSQMMSYWIESSLGWGLERVSGAIQVESRTTGFFEWCSKISHQIHEGEPVRGCLALALGSSRVSLVCKLVRPVDCANERAIGKLLLCSKDDLPAILRGTKIEGFGICSPDPNPPRRDPVVVSGGGGTIVSHRSTAPEFNSPHKIEFMGHGVWRWSYFGVPVFEVQNGDPGGPKVDLSAEMFRDIFAFVFQNRKWKAAWNLVDYASKARHGSLIIISESAPDESDRLQVGFKVNAERTPPQLLRRLCCMDGAVLASPDGLIHGFGVILDGRASRDVGDIARGSRFNAASRYFAAQREQNVRLIVVIISEDGFINTLPSRRSVMHEKLTLKLNSSLRKLEK